MTHVYLIAGEDSGDRLGAALMTGLRELDDQVTFSGIGGIGMAGQGIDSLFPMHELSVMGIAEILPKYRHLKRRIAQTAADVVNRNPDVLITIDSPDFCLRVARQVREKSNIRIVHYVAPSVWAWRPGRADKLAAHVDQVLALLPFEPPLLEAAGVRCDFVGHPIVAQELPKIKEINALRAELDTGDASVLLVLPGSRAGEVARLSPVFAETLQSVIAANPDLRIVVPAAGHVADQVAKAITHWPGNPVLLDPRGYSDADAQSRKFAAFALADFALAASGTVALELAATQTPMVIAYDMNWLSRQILSRMLMTDTINLINLVDETRHIPELLGNDCKPGLIAAELNRLIQDPDAQKRQIAAMNRAMDALGRGGEAPGMRAARAVMSGLEKQPGAH